MRKFSIYFLIIIFTFLFGSCFNPFAPRINNSSSEGNILSDQKTIDGLFQNFAYSYTFKDTTIYGQLLTDDFVFSYFDYELGVEVSWDRSTDMRTTEGLFANTQSLILIWNNIVYQSGDSLDADVKRSFNLTITFNPNDILNFYGFADMTLHRPSAADVWKIKKWIDETNP